MRKVDHLKVESFWTWPPIKDLDRGQNILYDIYKSRTASPQLKELQMYFLNSMTLEYKLRAKSKNFFDKGNADFLHVGAL